MTHLPTRTGLHYHSSEVVYLVRCAGTSRTFDSLEAALSFAKRQAYPATVVAR